MIMRYSASFGSAAAVTFGLLLVMQLLIAGQDGPLINARAPQIVDFLRVVRTPPPPPPEDFDLIEPVPPDPPPPRTRITGGDEQLIVIDGGPSTPPLPAGTDAGIPRKMDGELLSIVTVAPNYPQSALQRGLEGYVVVRYTVSHSGAVRDVAVVESTDHVFERAAIDAAYRFKYRPRVVHGEPVEVHGVVRVIRFVLSP